MVVGFITARMLSHKLSPVLWSFGDNSFVVVVPDGSGSLQPILGMMLGVEIGVVVAFFVARTFLPRGLLINNIPGGGSGV